MTRITDDSLRRFAGYGMKRAFNTIQTDLNAILAPFDLRMITYSALSVIDENAGLNQSQLAELLAVERPNLVSIVDQLERRDLLLRTRTEDDRRSNALSLTDDGKALLRAATRAVEDHDRRMTRTLSNSERNTLGRLLAKIETAGTDRDK